MTEITAVTHTYYMTERIQKKQEESYKGSSVLQHYMNAPGIKRETEETSGSTPAAVRESVEYGADQGGLLDWFRGLFGRSKSSRRAAINAPLRDLTGPRISLPEDEPQRSKTAPQAALSVSDTGSKGETDDGWEMPEYYAPFAGDRIRKDRIGKVNTDRNIEEWYLENKQYERKLYTNRPGLVKKLQEKYKDVNLNTDISGSREKSNISGLNLLRTLDTALSTEVTEGMSDEQVLALAEKLGTNIIRPGTSGKEAEKNDQQYMGGLLQLKELYYKQLKRLEATYGTMPTDLHPEDFIRQIGDLRGFFTHIGFIQDAMQLLYSNNGEDKGYQLFDFENNPKDREFRQLTDYYMNIKGIVQNYAYLGFTGGDIDDYGERISGAVKAADGVDYGIGLQGDEQKAYRKDLKKRAAKGGWLGKLFGAFRS